MSLVNPTGFKAMYTNNYCDEDQSNSLTIMVTYKPETDSVDVHPISFDVATQNWVTITTGNARWGEKYAFDDLTQIVNGHSPYLSSRTGEQVPISFSADLAQNRRIARIVHHVVIGYFKTLVARQGREVSERVIEPGRSADRTLSVLTGQIEAGRLQCREYKSLQQIEKMFPRGVLRCPRHLTLQTMQQRIQDYDQAHLQGRKSTGIHAYNLSRTIGQVLADIFHAIGRAFSRIFCCGSTSESAPASCFEYAEGYALGEWEGEGLEGGSAELDALGNRGSRGGGKRVT